MEKIFKDERGSLGSQPQQNQEAGLGLFISFFYLTSSFKSRTCERLKLTRHGKREVGQEATMLCDSEDTWKRILVARAFKYPRGSAAN